MMKIEALIQPFTLDEVKTALAPLGLPGIMISEVFEYGASAAVKATYRGVEYRVDAPKVKLEILASSLQVDEVTEALLRAARTTGPGTDGTILIYEVADAIQIRSGDRIKFAVF